jgi:tetratricopeptide (TPR) repeat protein
MAWWTFVSSAARVTAVAALIAVAGCATRSASLASRFVKPGEPSATFDDPEAPAPKAPPLSDYMRKIRALQSRAVPKGSFLPTIESTDPALAKALLILRIQETPATHRLVASAYRRAGVLDYAYKHFQRATVLDPCDAVSYDGMARIWRDWGMPDVALSEAYRALHCNQQSAEIYNTLGTILEALGQPGSALGAYTHAVAIDPRAAFALNNLCYVEMDAGHQAAAAAYCERALAVAPDFVAARNNLALIQARNGDVVGAEQQLTSGPASASSLYNVGVLRLSEARYKEAAAAFDQAAAVQPSMILARQRSVQARKAARAAEPSR